MARPPSAPAPAQVEQVAEELYALPPEQFVAARDARVRQLRAAGQRADSAAVAKLPRPTAAAHLVNLLARAHRADLAGLLDLGPLLRQAQDSLDGAGLRALSGRRRAVVDALVRQAVAQAGRDVPAQVRGEVQGTLEAALLDDDVAADVRAGRLARAAERASFAGLDPGAPAPSPARTPGPSPARTPGPAPVRTPGPAPARTPGPERGRLRSRAAAPTRRSEPEPPAAPRRPPQDRGAHQAAARERREAERRVAADRSVQEARQARDEAATAAAAAAAAAATDRGRVAELRELLTDAQRRAAESELDVRRTAQAVKAAETAASRAEAARARLDR